MRAQKFFDLIRNDHYRFDSTIFSILFALPFALIAIAGCNHSAKPSPNSFPENPIQHSVLFRRNSSLGAVGEVYSNRNPDKPFTIWIEDWAVADLAVNASNNVIAGLSTDRLQIRLFAWNSNKRVMAILDTRRLTVQCDLIGVGSNGTAVCWLRRNKDNTSSLWITKGTKTEELEIPGTALQMAMSPDAKCVAISKRSNRQFHPGVYENDLWILDTETKKEFRIGPGGSPAWSPDGKSIAVISGPSSNGNMIMLYELQSKERKVVRNLINSNHTALNWVSDSNSLVIFGILDPKTSLNPSLFIIDTKSLSTKEISPVPFSAEDDFPPKIWCIK